MLYAELIADGFRPDDSELSQLEAAGWALKDPVDYEPPLAIEGFRALDLNNFRMYFWLNGSAEEPTYMFAGTPHFERFRTLFPYFVDSTSLVIRNGFEPIDLDILEHNGGDGDTYTSHQHRDFYEVLVEPRLHMAWVVMSALIDWSDFDYSRAAGWYDPSRAVTRMFQR